MDLMILIMNIPRGSELVESAPNFQCPIICECINSCISHAARNIISDIHHSHSGQ